MVTSAQFFSTGIVKIENCLLLVGCYFFLDFVTNDMKIKAELSKVKIKIKVVLSRQSVSLKKVIILKLKKVKQKSSCHFKTIFILISQKHRKAEHETSVLALTNA